MKTLCWLWLIGIQLFADAHVFVYHRFGDDRYPTTNTTLEELRREFTYFKENGYVVVPLAQLVAQVKTQQKVPDNWVVLTIDDNFKSFYDNGLPIFKEFGYPFSLFVYVEATQKRYPDYLSWEELKEIGRFGSLEFHSYGHPHMTKLNEAMLKEDFDKGLALFEKHLGLKPTFFTYPYGEFDDRVKAIAKSYGFEGIINQNTGAVAHFSDAYDLDRAALVGEVNLQHFLRYRSLNASWQTPTVFPKDGVITRIHVKTPEKANQAQLYISGHGWEKVPMHQGDVDQMMNTKLLRDRSRVILTVGNKISTKILVKD